MKKQVVLTDSQKEVINNNIDKIPDLTELTRKVFEDEKLDGRSREGRAVRAYLAEQELEYSTKHIHKKEDIELNEAQKEFIRNNSAPGVSSLELAKLCFSAIPLKKSHKYFAVDKAAFSAFSCSVLDMLSKSFSHSFL